MRVGQGGLSEGRTLAGRYKLERKLGEGAFAQVWLAADAANSDLPVAVKVFQPNRKTNDPSYLLRFRNEAELLTKLRHDSIARVLNTITEPGLTAMVLEYVEGRTLRDEMFRRAKAKEAFELQEIGRAVDSLLAALDHAHTSGAIHRDVKPANLMVRALRGSASSALTVLDFGIARLVDLDAHEATTVGRMLGTVAYMSPEQTAAKAVDARSDLFSVGVILFEMLTGRRLWVRNGADQPQPIDPAASSPPNLVPALVAQILRGTRPRPGAFRAGVPADLDAAVLSALAVDPARRPASAAEMRKRVVPLLGVEPKLELASMAAPYAPHAALWAGVPRSVAQQAKVPGEIRALSTPKDWAPPPIERVNPVRREIQRVQYRRLLGSLRGQHRFSHLVVDESDDAIGVSGPYASPETNAVAELRFELLAGEKGLRLARTAPVGLPDVLRSMNGTPPPHVVLLSRLVDAFDEPELRARTERVSKTLDAAGIFAVTSADGILRAAGTPQEAPGIESCTAWIEAYVELVDLFGILAARFGATRRT
ncbi:MAG: protein kinase [Myxococcota bacterium]